MKRALASSWLVLGETNFKNSHSVETKPTLLKKTYTRNVPLQKVVKTEGFCSVVILFIIVVQHRAHGEVDEEDREEAEVEEEHLEKENMEEEFLIYWPIRLLTYLSTKPLTYEPALLLDN